MALSKREKYIASGVGVLIGVIVIYQIILSPYSDAFTDVNSKIADGQAAQKANSQLFEKRERLKKVWQEITAGGLKADESAAESQALNAALDWAQSAGVEITAVKPERTTTTKEFEVIGFHLTGNGSTPAVARLLLSFETANIPVRVDDMTLAPRKEGTDDLTIQLSLSTLCLKPDSTEAAAAKAAITDASPTEAQSWNE